MTELKLEFLLEEPEIPAEVDRLLLSFFKGICREIFSGTFRKTLYKKAIRHENILLVMLSAGSTIRSRQDLSERNSVYGNIFRCGHGRII